MKSFWHGHWANTHLPCMGISPRTGILVPVGVQPQRYLLAQLNQGVTLGQSGHAPSVALMLCPLAHTWFPPQRSRGDSSHARLGFLCLPPKMLGQGPHWTRGPEELGMELGDLAQVGDSPALISSSGLRETSHLHP